MERAAGHRPLIRVIDSHTAGEPTRLVLDGAPDLGRGPLAARARRFEAAHRSFCDAVLLEPRGHDAMVGALLVPPSAPDCAAGLIYFNTVGNLGMCGHATIGVAVTLAHLGRLAPGAHRFETPVGVVEARLQDAHTVSVANVESYRLRKDVALEVPGLGPVVGDVAWGGNWFFLTKDAPAPLTLAHLDALTAAAQRIRAALEAAGITGTNGAPIDHIELMGPASDPQRHGRGFVLCPGGAYDRSPCGTGCSAKIACLAADGLLSPGETWIQESVIDSVYSLSYRPGRSGGVSPTVTGQAFVTARADLLFDARDPYAGGIRP